MVAAALAATVIPMATPPAARADIDGLLDLLFTPVGSAAEPGDPLGAGTPGAVADGFQLNLGPGNTGELNLGGGNTGDENLGSGNTGQLNLGSGNTGDGNLGSGNTGSLNLGSGDKGDYNLGGGNTGDTNAGSGNHRR